MPPNDSQKGNHYIVFKIDIPKTISTQQQALFEELSKVEYPIDPKTVRFSDDPEESATGSGRGGSNKPNENDGNKESWEEDTDKLYDLFKKMFRKHLTSLLNSC